MNYALLLLGFLNELLEFKGLYNSELNINDLEHQTFEDERSEVLCSPSIYSVFITIVGI